MNDTPEAVQNLYRTLLMRRSGGERLHMGCAMFDTSRALARANLQRISCTEDELRVRLFLRTYDRMLGDGDHIPGTVLRSALWR